MNSSRSEQAGSRSVELQAARKIHVRQGSSGINWVHRPSVASALCETDRQGKGEMGEGERHGCNTEGTTKPAKQINKKTNKQYKQQQQKE